MLARLIRRCLPVFEEEGQASLRKALQDQNASQAVS